MVGERAGGGVDVESGGEATVALVTEAFVVALEGRAVGGGVGAAGEALGLLLVFAAGAGDGDLGGAGGRFVAGFGGWLS